MLMNSFEYIKKSFINIKKSLINIKKSFFNINKCSFCPLWPSIDMNMIDWELIETDTNGKEIGTSS